jgi:hypothetical protein
LSVKSTVLEAQLAVESIVLVVQLLAETIVVGVYLFIEPIVSSHHLLLISVGMCSDLLEKREHGGICQASQQRWVDQDLMHTLHSLCLLLFLTLLRVVQDLIF